METSDTKCTVTKEWIQNKRRSGMLVARTQTQHCDSRRPQDSGALLAYSLKYGCYWSG